LEKAFELRNALAIDINRSPWRELGSS